MSRAIKVEDQVYQELDMIRDKGETFSQIIERLLKARLEMFKFLTMVEEVLRYEKWKQEQLLEAIRQRQGVKAGQEEVDHGS